ncbi:sensor histidine kinase [Glaciihabitans sp. UYNi722]|uniref:sensor histidine kinase n=1 Tax=Glaciihabitans sp. UYNi722 TaxID=3156344 RepID=UPI0033908DD1
MSAAASDPLDTEWVRPLPDRRGYRGDGILAAVVLFGTTISLLLYSRSGIYPNQAPIWIDVLFLFATSVPLAFRRRVPEIVAIVTSIVFAAAQLLSVPELLFSNISLFIALYSLGAWGRSRPRATLVRLLIIVGMFVWILIELIARASNPTALPEISRVGMLSPLVAFGLIQILTNLLYFGGAYYFGDRAWAAARQRSALEARTRELASERERNADRAVATERLRIARELHDVVAHHVSVMGVQAGAARRVLSTNPEQAAASLEAIESNARSAIDELHHMLSTLRDDETTDAATESPSTRGVAQLADLVHEAEEAGLPIRFSTVGQSRALPATIGVIVFRIAQEAITNALKHAGPGADVDMRLRYLDTAVEIEVSDTGAGRVGPASGVTSGHGHIGMRERVGAVGGSIEIGARTRGGYLVRAAIPTNEDRS